MKSALLLHDGLNWKIKGKKPDAPDLVLAFLSADLPDMAVQFDFLRKAFKHAIVVGCSTSGEIFEDNVSTDKAAGVIISFEQTKTALARTEIDDPKHSFEAGARLANDLPEDMGGALAGVYVISDGLLVNGTELVAGMQSMLGDEIPLSGGLAGDADRFGKSYVGANNSMRLGQIAAIGFYGHNVKLLNSSVSGWNEFGHERVITRASDNILYELNYEPALDIYKRYLGEDAKDLPKSALLYPLKIYKPGYKEHELIRSVVGIDEEEKSLIFAGNMPEGYNARLMLGNSDDLVTGAERAARALPDINPEKSVALLVSCIGRLLVMGPRAYEEVLEVKDCLQNTPQIGFYSYGEISPNRKSGRCDLHNQTMAITIITEDAA